MHRVAWLTVCDSLSLLADALLVGIAVPPTMCALVVSLRDCLGVSGHTCVVGSILSPACTDCMWVQLRQCRPAPLVFFVDGTCSHAHGCYAVQAMTI